MITPSSLALIREAYHDAAQRGRAIVYWGLGGSVAAAAGPVLGGVLTQIDWRLIFFVNLPVGAAALMVLSRVAPSPRRPMPFDWLGQITAVLALASLTYGIIEGAEVGYGSPEILTLFAVCAARSPRSCWRRPGGRHPMVPLDLFRSRTVSTALAIAVVTMAAFYGVVFLQSLYFQQQRGATALETGLLFLPMTGLVALLNPLAARLMVRYGNVAMIAAGQLLMAVGLAGLWLLPADAPVLLVALVMVPVGVGGSFTVPPIIALVMDNVPAERAGTASGVVNTARQVGGSLGVAILAPCSPGRVHGRAAHQPRFDRRRPRHSPRSVPAAAARKTTALTTLPELQTETSTMHDARKGEQHETHTPSPTVKHPRRGSPATSTSTRSTPARPPPAGGRPRALHPRCPHQLAFPPPRPDPALHRAAPDSWRRGTAPSSSCAPETQSIPRQVRNTGTAPSGRT